MIKFTITPAKPVGVLKREYKRVLKRGMQQMGEWWHRQYRRKHFTAAGAREYRYAPRSRAYQQKKRRLKGHNKPLVYSGASQTLARARNVRATAKGVRVIMRIPMFSRLDAEYRGELVRMSKREIGHLLAQLGRYIERKMKPV